MTITMASIPQPAVRVKSPGGERPVGEVRVKVQLRNAFDQMRARRGEIPSDQIRVCEVEAVVDTGAVSSVIPPFVAEQLGLDTPKQRVAQYADGREETVPVTEPVEFTIHRRDATVECLVLGDEVLIGQTVLEMTDLLVDCANQRVVPNPAHPDQPVLKIR
jgi:clan AA aspartic protease